MPCPASPIPAEHARHPFVLSLLAALAAAGLLITFAGGVIFAQARSGTDALPALSARQRLQRAIDVSRTLAAKGQQIDDASLRSLGLAPFENIDRDDRHNKALLVPGMKDVEAYRRARPWASAYAPNPAFLRPMLPDVDETERWPVDSDAPELRKLLDDKNPAMRCVAAEALATLHQPEDVPRIGRLLRDSADGLPALGWNRLMTARFVEKKEIVAGKLNRMRSWRDRSVAATARLALKRMTGEDLTAENFDAWWRSNRGGRDRIWYWQERLTRELAAAEARTAADWEKPQTGNISGEAYEAQRIGIIARQQQRFDAVRQLAAKELERLPAEIEAKVRLFAINRYSTGLGVDLDAPLMGPFRCRRMSSDRLLELLDRQNLWDDVDWHSGYNKLATQVLGQAEVFFGREQAPRLRAIVEREYVNLGWNGKAAAVIGISHLLPAAGADNLDDPNTRDGWLRSKLPNEGDLLVRGRLADELVRVGLPENWKFLEEQFFAETGWKDRTDVRQSILHALGDEPLSVAKRTALVELVLDKRFAPLWTKPNQRMGDDMYRQWAMRAVNAFAGKELLTDQDKYALTDPIKSEKALAEVIRKVATLKQLPDKPTESRLLKVSLVPAKGVFTYGEPVKVRFDVKNISKEPLGLWSRGCSWGHEVYHFEITMPDGSVVQAEEPPMAWDRNWPQTQTLEPGKTFSVEFDLMRLTAGPLPPGEFHLSGIYRSSDLKDKKNYSNAEKFVTNLWIGQSATDPVRFTLKPTWKTEDLSECRVVWLAANRQYGALNDAVMIACPVARTFKVDDLVSFFQTRIDGAIGPSNIPKLPLAIGKVKKVYTKAGMALAEIKSDNRFDELRIGDAAEKAAGIADEIRWRQGYPFSVPAEQPENSPTEKSVRFDFGPMRYVALLERDPDKNSCKLRVDRIGSRLQDEKHRFRLWEVQFPLNYNMALPKFLYWPDTIEFKDGLIVAHGQYTRWMRPFSGYQEKLGSPDAKPTSSQPDLSVARQNGETRAKADIANGTLQILYCGKPWSAGKPLIDDESKLPVKVVAGCTVSAEFVAETDAYNAVMQQAAKDQQEREQATRTYRDGPKGPKRTEAAKLLYSSIKLGMTTSDVILRLGVPDGAKGGQLSRFFDYSVGKGQEIEIEFDRNTQKVIRKHEVGLGIDPPSGPPAAIPEKLRSYVKDYATSDTTLRAGFVPYKAELVWGEPLDVTFMVENLGPKDFEFMFGGDYRGIGRNNRIKVEVTDAAGKLLPDPHEGAPEFGGMMSREILTPGGKVFTRTFDLLHFRTIDKPGEYTVTCSFAFDEPYTRKTGPAQPVVKSSFHLTILARTPQRVAGILDELVAKARSVPENELGAAMALIARFGQDDAAPRLVALAQKGPIPQRVAAFGALPLVPTDASLTAAVSGLRDAEPAIRSAAAAALGAMQKPAGVDALLAALPKEQSPLAEAILVALGSSKSPRAFPVIAGKLADGTEEMKSAAVTALVAFDGPEAVAGLKQHVDTDDTALRYQIVLALVEKLHQPLDTDWILPVLMCRGQDRWIDSLRLVRMYGGERAIPTLLSCLDFDAAWSNHNWWILSAVEACPNAPATNYDYDPNSDGTPQQWEKNRQTLQRLQKLAGPIPAATTRPKKNRPAYLTTDPPIDFTPRLKPVDRGVEIQTGFLKLTINRNGYTIPYTPSNVYRPTYQVAGDVRALLGRPDLFESLGITPRQAEQLRKLAPPPDFPVDTGWTQLYIAYKDAPAGPLHAQTADDLCDAVRAASQSYHQAHAAFAEAAKRILSTSQVEQLHRLLNGAK